jgi:adenine-specific DNA-methyltransferase
MRIETKREGKQEQRPKLFRRLRDLQVIAARLKGSQMSALQVCDAIIEKRLADRNARAFFSGLPDDEKHYWIASLYGFLMPKARRRRLAAYFTPPYLAQYAINLVMQAGIYPGQHRILDPASGGAAFLVPLAARIAKNGHERGARAKTILQDIKRTLHGVETEPGLAGLSDALLRDLLRAEIESSGLALDSLVQRANTLELDPPLALYDAVIGNPPYGRILRPTVGTLERYRPVISSGYVNLYALFLEQALQWVRPGGVICFIIPTSFVGGPNFAALRRSILQAAARRRSP